MAQEYYGQVNNAWTALADLITVDGDTTYHIQNRGGDDLLLCEGADEPSIPDGVVAKPYKSVEYKKGTDDLYLKANSTGCYINITSEE